MAEIRPGNVGAEDILFVYTTTGSEQQANSIAAELVQRQLAACVNVISGVKSTYRWKNEVFTDEEYLLVIKTTREGFDPLRRTLKTIHSYELPELLAVPVVAGDDAVIDWVRSVVKPKKSGAR